MPGFYYDLCFLCNITAIHGNCKYLLFDWKKTILILSYLSWIRDNQCGRRENLEIANIPFWARNERFHFCWENRKIADVSKNWLTPPSHKAFFSPFPFKSYVFLTAFCKLSTNFGPKIKNSIFGFSIKKCWRQQKLGHRGQPKLCNPYPHP